MRRFLCVPYLRFLTHTFGRVACYNALRTELLRFPQFRTFSAANSTNPSANSASIQPSTATPPLAKPGSKPPGHTVALFLQKCYRKGEDLGVPSDVSIPRDSDVVLYEKMTGIKQPRDPLLTLVGYYTRRPTAIRVAKLIIFSCFLQANRIELALRKSLGDHATIINDRESFKSWFSMATLHIWLCYNKLRSSAETEGNTSDVRLLLKELVDNFFVDVEYRIVAQGVDNPIVLRKNLNAMADYYFQALCSYDKALASGKDEVFAEAIWQNVFGRDLKGVGVRRIGILSSLVAYVRRALVVLDMTEQWKVRCAFIDWGGMPDFPPGPPPEETPLEIATQAAGPMERIAPKKT